MTPARRLPDRAPVAFIARDGDLSVHELLVIEQHYPGTLARRAERLRRAMERIDLQRRMHTQA